jgi:hypothetical protein
VPKGDKKQRKRVLDEIAILESNLKEKHLLEMQAFPKEEHCLETSIKDLKISKAEQRRINKAARMAAVESEDEPDNNLREIERTKIAAILADKKLQIKDVPEPKADFS